VRPPLSVLEPNPRGKLSRTLGARGLSLGQPDITSFMFDDPCKQLKLNALPKADPAVALVRSSQGPIVAMSEKC